MERQEYCDRVLAVLRRLTPEEREAVRRELDGHMEDHICALTEGGYTAEEAQQRAAEAMGDPEEMGRALAKQYPLGWLVLSRMAMAVLLFTLVWAVLGFGALGNAVASLLVRIEPEWQFELHEDMQAVDLRAEVGSDVLRVYGVRVFGGEKLKRVEVRYCIYDKIPFGVINQRLGDRLRLENVRGETLPWTGGGSGGGSSGYTAVWGGRTGDLSPGDTAVVLRYDGFGERVALTIPLPEEDAA